jgi:hypothetical protein
MTMHVNTHGNVYKYKGIRFEKRHPQKCKNLLQRYSGDAECMKNTPENPRKGVRGTRKSANTYCKGALGIQNVCKYIGKQLKREHRQKCKHLLQRYSGDAECMQIHSKTNEKRAPAKVQAPTAEVRRRKGERERERERER